MIRKVEITRQKVRTKHISCAIQKNELYVEFNDFLRLTKSFNLKFLIYTDFYSSRKIATS